MLLALLLYLTITLGLFRPPHCQISISHGRPQRVHAKAAYFRTLIPMITASRAGPQTFIPVELRDHECETGDDRLYHQLNLMIGG